MNAASYTNHASSSGKDFNYFDLGDVIISSSTRELSRFTYINSFAELGGINIFHLPGSDRESHQRASWNFRTQSVMTERKICLPESLSILLKSW